MRSVLVTLALLVSVAAPAAGQTPTVSTDRLGWDQAMTAAEVPEIAFAAFVDGGPKTPLTATCALSGTPDVYSCVAPYPPMMPGKHSIELIAIRTVPDGPNPPLVVESPRSEPFPFHLVVAPATPGGVRNVRGGNGGAR